MRRSILCSRMKIAKYIYKREGPVETLLYTGRIIKLISIVMTLFKLGVHAVYFYSHCQQRIYRFSRLSTLDEYSSHDAKLFFLSAKPCGTEVPISAISIVLHCCFEQVYFPL